MISNASLLTRKLRNQTQKRVEMVMQYVIYCYQKMLSDGKIYNKNEFQNEDKTRYNLEEGLSEKLVEDYLGIWKNKEHYKRNISRIPSVDIFFHYEPKQTYTENKSSKDDYIDIKVTESIISDIWGNAGEQQQVHFAIECKIVENGYTEYVSDIKKMCDRPFNTPRLPFEGQIAYILNSNYTPIKVKQGINRNLNNNKSIITIQELNDFNLVKNFNESYTSIHKRNYNSKKFKIYHLLLNYSNIVI